MVTGSSGFIGRHLVKYLIEKNYKVVEVDRLTGREVIDLKENDLKDIDIVVHLAAQTSVWNDDIEQIEKDNIQSFIHIFNLCKYLNKRFIYASSSCSVNITSMYGLSKHFDDLYADIYGWDECIGLRFHNVYGMNPRPDTLLGVCMTGKVTMYNNGKNLRHFTYVDDVCKAIEKSFSLKKGLYNVLNPEINSVEEFVGEVSKYTNIDVFSTDDLRDYDKDSQFVNSFHENLLEDHYTSLGEGIHNIFSKKERGIN